MATERIFAENFTPQPYWWNDRKADGAEAPAELPADADVVVVGGGYTGLNAALQTARQGLSTLVLDAETPGWGCSTRNGGQISTSIKPSFGTLTRRYGEDRAVAILREGKASLDYMHALVRDEALDCDLRAVGRFHGAHKRRHYDALARECEADHPAFKTDAYMVPRADMASELGTDAYHGGVVFPHHCSIDAGRYHAALLERVIAAGALVRGQCRVEALQRTGSGFRIGTSAGSVNAGQVVLATNGYSGPLSPWHRRRIIPIGSYVIATEPIERAIMDRIMPTDRILSDTRKLVYYYRPSPDRTRVLFGGRVSLSETDPRKSAVRLHRELARLFPDLETVRVSHSWMGFVGYTFDTLAHAGHDGGLHYAMGYCGSGVGMASYLGMRIGRRAAGQDGSTAFDDLPFPTRPFYSGNPWFLAPSVMAYRLRDALGI